MDSAELAMVRRITSAAQTLDASLGLTAKETRRYSLLRALRAQVAGDFNPAFRREAAFERECSAAIARKIDRANSTGLFVPSEILQRSFGDATTRALSTQPGSKGGFLIGAQMLSWIDVLRARSVAVAMGARQISDLIGQIVAPRQTGKASTSWQAGDGITVAATDQALGSLSLTPRTCIAITEVSEQLLRQTSQSAEDFFMADLASCVAIDGLDNAVINGTGGSMPLGIKNMPGITTGQDASSATYAKILAFLQTAGAANALRANPGFVTNTAGAVALAKVQRFAGTDSPLWQGSVFDGTLASIPAMSSEQVASGNLIFGSWDEVVIGDWGVLELNTDRGGTRFNQGQVGIRALWMVDVCLRHPQSFVVSTNLS